MTERSAIRAVFDTPKKRLGRGRYQLGEYVIQRHVRPVEIMNRRTRNRKVFDGWDVLDKHQKVVARKDRLWQAEQLVKGRMIKALRQQVKMRRILFLDIDGVLTTAGSRVSGGPEHFKPSAARALERLLGEGKVDKVVMHSSWRKLPAIPDDVRKHGWTFPSPDGWWYWDIDWWQDLCKFQNMPTLAAIDFEQAPYKMSSGRGNEVGFWLRDNEPNNDRYVILDDETEYFEHTRYADWPNMKVVRCNDITGLTDVQVTQVLKWWAKPC